MSCYQYFLQYLNPEKNHECLIGSRFRSKIPISLNYYPCNNHHYLTKWRKESIIVNPCPHAFELKIEPPFDIRIISVIRQSDGSYLVIADFLQDLSLKSITEGRECVNRDWIKIKDLKHKISSTKNLSAIIDIKDLGLRFEDKIRIDGDIFAMLS